MRHALELVALAAALHATAALAAERPNIAKVCTNCHEAQAGTVRGYLESVTFKSNSMQIRIDEAVEVIRFDPDAVKVVHGRKTDDGDLLLEAKKGHEMLVTFVEKDGAKFATAVSLKPAMAVPAELIIKTPEVEKLVQQGPEKGKYTLIDSRPLPRFQEGFIPTAINLPYPAFDKMVGKLPADKSSLVVFYCAGPTCSMSPKSADKAKALGYTNIRIYADGMPAWSNANPGVLTVAFLKEAWIDKDIPVVLFDARADKEAAKGSILGAVLAPAKVDPQTIEALELPPSDKKPPIVVFDEGKGEAADRFARGLIRAGYNNVRVLQGGFAAWQAARYEAATGALAKTVRYAPKPKAGEIKWDEFQALARAIPADTMVLDVRNSDEVKQWMIPGAKNIPEEELGKRLAEVPQDKRIVTHCSTGVRAEMAYHQLKERGYPRVAFVNANVDFDPEGGLKLSR